MTMSIAAVIILIAVIGFAIMKKRVTMRKANQITAHRILLLQNLKIQSKMSLNLS